MSEDYFKDKIGARLADNITYASVNEEEAGDFMKKEMKTKPDTPLAVFDVEEQVLGLNNEEYWSLVSHAISEVEKASRNHYGLAWEAKAEQAHKVDNAHQYSQIVSDENFEVNLLSVEEINATLESEDQETDWNFVKANDVAGIPTKQDYDDI